MIVKTLSSTLIRATKLGVLGLAVATGVGFGVAVAYPANSVEYEYFSDATYNESVGGKGITCGGNQWRWGEQTPYFVFYTEPCG